MGQYNLILPDSLHKRFVKKARKEHGSAAQVIVRLIKRWLNGDITLD